MGKVRTPPSREDQLLQHLHDARMEFGRARLKLGLLLDVVKRESLWQGRAESFTELLDDLGLNQKGAATFMRVAKSLFEDHALPSDDIDQLVGVSMSILEIAVKVMTPENKDTVIGLVTALNPRDARCALHELAMSDGVPLDAPGVTDPARRAIARVLNAYSDLADEQRYEVRTRLRMSDSGANGTDTRLR